jgi:hypothetical protein
MQRCREVATTFAGAPAATDVLSVAGSAAVTPRSSPRPMGPTACLAKARCPMLELYAPKGARTVLRGREGSDPLLLPDPFEVYYGPSSRRTKRMPGVPFGACRSHSLRAAALHARTGKGTGRRPGSVGGMLRLWRRPGVALHGVRAPMGAQRLGRSIEIDFGRTRGCTGPRRPRYGAITNSWARSLSAACCCLLCRCRRWLRIEDSRVGRGGGAGS